MAGKMEKPMNIYQKLVEVRREVKRLTKDKEGYGYSYTSGSNVLSSIRDKMDELSILLSPEITEQSKEQTLVKVWDKRAKAMVEKVEWIIELKIKYTWINAENPEDRYEVLFAGFGQQSDPSQAFGAALTYSERYFVLKELQIPTDDDDPDAKQNGEKQNISTGNGKKEAKPNCPKCGHSKHVIAAKYKVEERGKWLCWKKKDQDPTGCGEQFNTAPPKNAPETPPGAPQATNGGNGDTDSPDFSWMPKYIKKTGEYKESLKFYTGDDSIYYSILKAHGYKKANECKDKVKFSEMGEKLAWAARQAEYTTKWKEELGAEVWQIVLNEFGMMHDYDYDWNLAVKDLQVIAGNIVEFIDNIEETETTA